MEIAVPAAEIIDRLFRDQPLFHALDAAGARWLAEQGIAMEPGDFTLNVSAEVLWEIAAHVTPASRTIETGAGFTTVLLAATARHHRCHTVSAIEAQRIGSYLAAAGIDRSRVTFAIGPSDRTLAILDPGEPFDLAFVDGCHGYPYPAMDWHYIDRALRVGGVLGMDNAELRPVAEHCRFLEENGSYRLLRSVEAPCGYIARFYRKERDEPREWNLQPYSARKPFH